MKIKIWISIILISSFIYLASNCNWQNITDIDAVFCNSWSLTENLNFSTYSAKSNEICIQFTNTSDKDIWIKIWFPDWTLTNDSFKNRACKWEWNIQDFWKYVTQKNKTLIIPAHTTIIEKDSIKFPAWFDWIARGCLTYFLNQTNADLNQINVVVRQTSYIDILVWANFNRGISLQFFNKTNYWSTNKIINIESNFDSTMSLALNFVNSWDIDESFSWSWKIYDNLWFSKDFEIPQTKLLANSTKKLLVNIGKLPFYWWFFKIQLNWSIDPEISFNKDYLDLNLKSAIKIQEETTIKIIPRNIIILVIVISITASLVRHFKKQKTT